MEDKTLQYYQQNTESFVQGTAAVDFSSVADRFLRYLKSGSKILDFGCGSGRDSRYFLGHGFAVEAVDGSPELCAYASEYTGIQVHCMLFQELEETEVYDGIWACASILHVSKAELPDVFRRILHALKDDGVFYTSFKYGTYEGWRDGRYFTDFTMEAFEAFIKQFPELEILEEWMTGDVREGRSGEKWLNLILRKVDIR